MNNETKAASTAYETTTAGADAGQGEKMFTQKELDDIIRDRLSRDRDRRSTVSDERERELNAREARLGCREYLTDCGLSPVLLEVLDTSSVDAFKAAVSKLQEAGFSPATVKAKPKTGILQGASFEPRADDIAAAFKRGR